METPANSGQGRKSELVSRRKGELTVNQYNRDKSDIRGNIHVKEWHKELSLMVQQVVWVGVQY